MYRRRHARYWAFEPIHLPPDPPIDVASLEPLAELLGTSIPTANALVAEFERIGLLREMAGRLRDRVFRYEPYLVLLRGDA